MNSKWIASCLAATLLLGAALACRFSGNPTPTVGAEGAVTAVAATLTAVAAAAPSVTPTLPEATAAPSLTPAPAAILSVAYVDGERNLWLWQPGATPVRLVDSGDVADLRLSPDGSQVAYLRSPDYVNESLWLVRSDGSDRRELVSTADFHSMNTYPEAIGATAHQFEWIPGANRLAFNTRPIFEGLGLELHDDLWQVDVATGAHTPLLAPGSGGMFYYAPDGSQIALVTPEQISLVNADGSNRREAVLSYDPVITYSEYRYYPQPQWSPDGAFLRVAVPPADPLAEPLQAMNVWHIPASGATATHLASITAAPFSVFGLSPDLNRIAYLQQVGAPQDNTHALHIALADGSGDQIYYTGAVFFNGWAPDSQHFTFSIGTGDNAQLGQVGDTFSALNESGPATNVTWPDAAHFIYLSKTDGNWQIRLGTVGAASTLIAEFPAASDGQTPVYDTSLP